MTTNSNHEKSPLLLSSSTTYEDEVAVEDEDEVAQGSATVSQTTLNLSKTSMGTIVCSNSFTYRFSWSNGFMIGELVVNFFHPCPSSIF